MIYTETKIQNQLTITGNHKSGPEFWYLENGVVTKYSSNQNKEDLVVTAILGPPPHVDARFAIGVSNGSEPYAVMPRNFETRPKAEAAAIGLAMIFAKVIVIDQPLKGNLKKIPANYEADQELADKIHGRDGG